MIKIIADTTSSIPVSVAKQLGIYYFPQIVIFGNESYRDDTEIDTQTFLRKLRASPDLPKTAAPAPALYTPIYQQLLAEGHTPIVICPSAELSGTYRSATLAAQDFPNADIRVVDTRTLGSGLASIILEAVQWANQGLDADTIVQKIKEMASRERVYFVVDTLEYLHKGGRIGGAQALLGSILQVKPILTLKNGRAEPVESQRTKRRALARVIELVAAEYPRNGNAHLCLMHGDAEEGAKALADQLRQMFRITEIPIYELPPAILVHAGPGVLAISFFVENSQPVTPQD